MDFCKWKENSGLGIKNLEKFNLALVGKWLGRALNEKNNIWVKVLVAKYGKGDEWLEKKYKGKGSIWWRDLREVYQLEVDRGG